MAEHDDRLFEVASTLPPGEFTTADFVDHFRRTKPALWQELEARQGKGGKGNGHRTTIYTYLGQSLGRLARAGRLTALGYKRDAPDGWGNPWIAHWSMVSVELAQAGESDSLDDEFREGTLQLKLHLKRERAWRLAGKKKTDFVAKHGKLYCERCRLDPVEAFGSRVGCAVIEVHHAAISVSKMESEHKTKLDDLQCLCANCHRLVHAEMNLRAQS